MATDEQIKQWPEGPGNWTTFCEWECVLHDHMGAFLRQKSSFDWCDVSREATRVYSAATGIEVEEGSPIDAFFSATAAAGSSAALKNVASHLGVTEKEIEDLSNGDNVEGVIQKIKGADQ